MLRFARLLPPPSRDEVDPDELEEYDGVIERTGRVHGMESNPANYFGALAYTVFCGFLTMASRLWQALGVPALTEEETDELVQGLLDGTVETPDPAARIG